MVICFDFVFGLLRFNFCEIQLEHFVVLLLEHLSQQQILCRIAQLHPLEQLERFVVLLLECLYQKHFCSVVLPLLSPPRHLMCPEGDFLSIKNLH